MALGNPWTTLFTGLGAPPPSAAMTAPPPPQGPKKNQRNTTDSEVAESATPSHRINRSRETCLCHRAHRLSRPGARCRDYSRSVSPDRSPNPACDSHRTGLSTVPAVVAGVTQGPRIGDRATPPSVPGNRHRFEVEQLDPVRRDRPPPPIGRGQPAPASFHLQRCSVRHHWTTRHQAK